MSGRISAFWSEKGPLLAAMLADPAWYKGHLFRTRDAARELGCSLVQVQNKIANLRHGQPISDQVVEIPKAPAPPPEPPAPPPVDPLVLERERQERIRTLKQERELLTAVAGEQSLRAFLESLTAKYAVPFPPPKPAKPTPVKGGTTVESLVIQLSDWHAYQVVRPERPRGFNGYDAAIMGRRVYGIVQAKRSITSRMERSGGWRFPHLVIGANGDFVSGTIHEAERHSDAANIVQAVYGCARVFAQAVRDLAEGHETVEVFCTSGNHGRLPDAKRMQQADPTRNWDTMIYLFAREMLRSHERITFYIPDAYSVAFDVAGWRFMQTHGHDVKSWNSIPHYGINRYVSNLNALEASRGTPINYFLFGHFHNKTSLEHAAGEWFINGSLIGATEFGVNALGKADKPCQWLVGVHPEHGVTHRWPLSGVVADDAPSYDVRPMVTDRAA
ncbi:MAG: hypothetical protein IT352_07445 [Gemmatimonadales bacterium]|nr:hypothetical protein [Gemmatimonadales bacterium]